MWPPAITSSGHGGPQAPSPTAAHPHLAGPCLSFPTCAVGSGQVPARGVCTASCQHSCLQLPAARGDAWPGHIRSAPAKAPQRRWVSLQGPISTELIKNWNGGGRGGKDMKKLQKSRDGTASLPDPPGPSGLGEHCPGGELAFLRGCSGCLRDRVWLPGSGKPHRICAPSRFGRGANLAAPWPGCARLCRSPGPAPLLTSEPRVLPGHLSGPSTTLRKETSTNPPGSCRAASLKLQQQQHPGCWEGKKRGVHLSGEEKLFKKK